MLEKWQSQSHLEKHLQIEHMLKHRETIKDYVLGTGSTCWKTRCNPSEALCGLWRFCLKAGADVVEKTGEARRQLGVVVIHRVDRLTRVQRLPHQQRYQPARFPIASRHKVRQLDNARPAQRQLTQRLPAGGRDRRFDGEMPRLPVTQRPLVQQLRIGESQQAMAVQIFHAARFAMPLQVIRAGENAQPAVAQQARV